MKVLFLTPPLLDYGFHLNNVSPYIEYGQYAAILLRSAPGVHVEILECPAHRITKDQLEDELKKRSPDIIVVGGQTSMTPDAMDCLQLAKTLSPKIFTVAEGPHFGAIPKESLEACSAMDFVLVGEADITLLELVKIIVRKDTNYGDIKGLAWRNGKEIVINAHRPLINNLDDLPLPAYHLMDMDKNLYRQYDVLDHYTRIYTSRGCKGRCEFCYFWPVYHGAYRTRSGRSVAEEIIYLNKTYGIRFFNIYDPSFGEDALMVENFCQTLIEQKADVQMWCMARADSVVHWNEHNLLPKLRQAGLKFVIIGVEHHLDERREKMGKGIKTVHLKSAYKLLRENGIASAGSSMVGWEDDTEEDAESLYSFMVNELKPDIPSFFCANPEPGSLVWNKLKDNPALVKDFRNYNMMRPVMPTKTIPMQKLGEIVMRLWGRYYSDVSKVQPLVESGNEVLAANVKYLMKSFAQLGKERK